MIFTISLVSATSFAVRVAVYDIECNPIHNDVASMYSNILIECEISYIFSGGRRQSAVEGCVSV